MRQPDIYAMTMNELKAKNEHIGPYQTAQHTKLRNYYLGSPTKNFILFLFIF